MALGVSFWRAVLAPWEPQVQVALPRHYQNRLDPIPNLPPEARHDFYSRLREAYELLETLAVVERILWTNMLPTLLYSEYKDWKTSSLPVPYEDSPFEALALHLINPSRSRYCDRDGLSVVEFARIFFAFDESSMSTEFRRAMQTIHAALDAETKRRLADRKPILVSIALRMDQAQTRNSATEFLLSVGDLARRIGRTIAAAAVAAQGRDDGEWVYRSPFAVASMDVWMKGDYPYQEPGGVLTAMSELMALGVKCILFDLGVQRTKGMWGRDQDVTPWYTNHSASEIGRVLQGYTDASSLRASIGIGKVIPELGPSDLQFTIESSRNKRLEHAVDESFGKLGAIFSALAVTRDAQTLKLSLQEGGMFSAKERELYAKWFAYALFSKDSTSSIRKLTFSDSNAFMLTDAATFARVLAAKNPSRVLLDESYATESSSRDWRDDDRDLGFAVVKAGTQLKSAPLDPTSEERASDVFAITQDGRFRVMRDNEDCKWVDIVVPCYGHCLVAREAIDHIEQSTITESSYSTGYSGSITTLKVCCMDFDFLIPLLRFVSPKVLHFANSHEIYLDDIRHVLEACPNLTELFLHDSELGVDQVFTDAYESGACKIESLDIDQFWSDDDASPAFFRRLQDPEAAVTKRLKRLMICSFELQDEVFDAFVGMLAVNRSLYRFELDTLHERFEARESELRATAGLWLCKRPLCSTKRVAFLSVVRHFSSSCFAEPSRKRSRQSRESRDLDLGGLESAVVALIFDFAADGICREIVVGGYTAEYDY